MTPSNLGVKRTRRANGEDSIYQDAAGQWHGWVTLGRKPNGKPDRRHRRGTTRQEVVDKLGDLKDRRAKGERLPAGKRWTVEQWMTYWLDNIAGAKVTEGTMSGYRPLVERHIIPGLGGHPLADLEPEHVEALYRRLARQGMAPATVLKVHRILSRALKVAVQRGRVERNVCTLVDAPSADRAEAAALTADEARAVLATAMKTRLGARWAFAMEVGCRQAEALGLRWSDLVLDETTGRGQATIRRQLRRSPARHGCEDRATCPAKQPIRCPQAVGGGLVIQPYPKSKKPRQVALSTALVAVLLEHRGAQQGERASAGTYWSDDAAFGDLVFRQANGRPIDPRRDYGNWQEVLTGAGLAKAGTHLSRHTAASLLLEAGVPARVVMETLGHSAIRVTMDTYSHVSTTLATTAAEKIEGVLWR